MKKILIVFGTRPEAIKMAPLIKEFDKEYKIFDLKICVTAQHREMLDQVLNIFDIKPDYDLNIMKSGQDLYDVTTNVMLGMREVLNDADPDIVFVHGDTATTFAATLSSFYKKIPVAHVEAGLRTGDIYSPWPEEANRKLTSQIATYHFSPTNTSRENLIIEGVDNTKIVTTGNTVIDALMIVLEKIKSDSVLELNIKDQLLKMNYLLDEKRRFVLVTGHRRENFGQGFLDICEALKTIASNNPDCDVVYPVHLNPNVQKPVKDLLSGINNIHLIEPLDYEPFVYLMSKSSIILTDSGGIQEEAPSLGKPVIVMRDTTERPEAIEAGTVKLVGTDKAKIIEEVQKLLDDKEEYFNMSKAHNPYGDGKSCKRIVDYLIGEMK